MKNRFFSKLGILQLQELFSNQKLYDQELCICTVPSFSHPLVYPLDFQSGHKKAIRYLRSQYLHESYLISQSSFMFAKCFLEKILNISSQIIFCPLLLRLFCFLSENTSPFFVLFPALVCTISYKWICLKGQLGKRMIVNVELDNQVLPLGVLDRGAPNGTKSEAGRRKGGGWLRC